MLNKIIIITISLFLTACATNKELVEVKIPIRVACSVETPDEPSWTIQNVNKDDDIYTKIKSLLSDRELSLAYEKELNTALEACKK